ncbi:MAG: NUDIX hydrolase [Ilumatobacteraceae bacterium]
MEHVVPDRRPGGDQVIFRPAQFRVRSDYPWNRVDGSVLKSLDQVIDKVVRYSTTLIQQPPPPTAHASAVLIALFQGDEGAEVVLTRRSQYLTNHKGEISFPGGRVDAHELVVDAALREAHEEINLPPEQVEVVGQLNATGTLVSNSHIVPIVARLQAKPSLEVRNTEVDRVFTVPLIDLIRQDTYTEEFWGAPTHEHRLHFFHLDDETIWGVTGRMLYQLLSIALAR